MGNTVASGSGNSLEVGKNCEKLSNFTSDIVLTFKSLYLYKIKYNNSKFGKACLAGTQDNNGIIIAQNKDFTFVWEFVENEDTGDVFIFGNHTKKCEKNSLALVEILTVEPLVLEANRKKISAVSRKFKNNSELANQIKSLRK